MHRPQCRVTRDKTDTAPALLELYPRDLHNQGCLPTTSSPKPVFPALELVSYGLSSATPPAEIKPNSNATSSRTPSLALPAAVSSPRQAPVTSPGALRISWGVMLICFEFQMLCASGGFLYKTTISGSSG